MPSQYVVQSDGLDITIQNLEDAPRRVRVAASRAINRAIRQTRTRSAREVRRQIAFPAQRLNQNLRVTEFSRPDKLEAVITGRSRPTSLARFARNRPRRGGRVRLNVKPGRTSVIPNAFLIPLRSGSADIETRANLGLALRLRPGERIQNKRAFRPLSNGLYLLFGPSVDQVFVDVAAEEAVPAADILEQEFLRQLDL